MFTPSANQIKIVNTNDLKVTTQVPENYIRNVNVGDNAQITLPDINKNITAKISVAGTIIDPNSRSFYVEIHLPTDNDLRPNQIAYVHIQDYKANNAITVPVNTLQTDEKGKYVLVAENEQGKLVAKKKAVSIGQSYSDKVEVLAGLQPGDKLITVGYQSLYDGQLITIKG
jgi:RND family efflux transporter MFP subunit